VTTTRFRRLALSCLSAALAWLTTYPFELWPLALVCWVPFVIAISRVGMREAIALGAANGALLNALAFHWLVDALVRGAGVSLGQALLLFGMFVVVQGGRTIVLVLLYQAGRRGALGVPVAFTMALVIAELVYPMVFPWQSAVFVQPIALWMQTADLGGTLAVSSWIALVNGMLASACLARLEASVAQAWRSVIGTAALVGLVSAYGHARMRLLENRLAASERVRAGVVQGYFASPTLPWEAVANYRRYLVRATTTGRTAVVDPSGRVIWQLPEATLASGVVEVRWVQGRSLYSALGDWPWIILSACYGVALTWRLRRTARQPLRLACQARPARFEVHGDLRALQKRPR
jgi:apolipoprotein N-acyltransferase